VLTEIYVIKQLSKLGIFVLHFVNLFLKIVWKFSRKISKATKGHKAAAGQLVWLFLKQETFLFLQHPTRTEISVHTLHYASFETMVQTPHTKSQTDKQVTLHISYAILFQHSNTHESQTVLPQHI